MTNSARQHTFSVRTKVFLNAFDNLCILRCNTPPVALQFNFDSTAGLSFSMLKK